MPTSVHLGNALAMDWAEVCPRPQCTPFSGTGRTAGAPSTDAPAVTAVHVATNPPFVGTQQRTPAQRTELARICRDLPRQGDLDYATAWFVLAAAYITDQPITAGFIVSANRITGVQGHGLWAYLARLGIGIRFACRPTRWRSKAIANPQVMVAIVGIAHGPVPAGTTLRLAEVGRATGATTVRHVARIGPDLTDLPDIAVPHRDEPPPGVPPACAGDAAADDGHLILSVAERAVLLKRHPRAQKYLRPYVTPISLLNGEPLWCLWLDEDDRGWLAMPAIAARVEAVRAVRAAKQGRVQRISTAPPHRFAFHRAVFSPGIVIPRCASERRITIPMVMVGADAVVGTGCAIIPGGMEEHLGVLMSAMHQAWTRQCAGRQEQRLRYAIRTVYNTFPWPMIDGQWDPVARERIAAATREILAVRAQHQTATGASLAKLYQSGAMPSDLRAAHEALSAAVDAAYDPNRRWTDDRSRVEYLVTEQRRRLGMLGVEAPAAAPLRTPTPAAHVLSA